MTVDKTTVSATKKAVKVATSGRPTKVSYWWIAVGFLGGVVGVFVFWWFIYPPLIALFY